MEPFNISPRQFKLDQLNEFRRAKVTILGINPGHILPFEAVAYQKILESALSRHGISLRKLEDYNVKACFKAFKDAYQEILEAWRRCYGSWNLVDVKIAYVRRAKHFLVELKDELNLRGGDPILWSNLVYCESAGRGAPPKKTVWTCVSKYFIELLQLSGDVIICLGWSSFKYVKKLKKEEAKTPLVDVSKLEMMKKLLANKSVIGIYHPSSRGTFSKYFEDARKKRIVERRLRDVFRQRIRDAVKARSAKFIDQNN